jgi:hypothetical protein
MNSSRVAGGKPVRVFGAAWEDEIPLPFPHLAEKLFADSLAHQITPYGN